jgi:hypothetical protein
MAGTSPAMTGELVARVIIEAQPDSRGGRRQVCAVCAILTALPGTTNRLGGRDARPC